MNTFRGNSLQAKDLNRRLKVRLLGKWSKLRYSNRTHQSTKHMVVSACIPSYPPPPPPPHFFNLKIGYQLATKQANKKIYKHNYKNEMKLKANKPLPSLSLQGFRTPAPTSAINNGFPPCEIMTDELGLPYRTAIKQEKTMLWKRRNGQTKCCCSL